MSASVPVYAQQTGDAQNAQAQRAPAEARQRRTRRIPHHRKPPRTAAQPPAKDAGTRQGQPLANVLLAQAAPTPPVNPRPARPCPSNRSPSPAFARRSSVRSKTKRNADSVVEVITADDIGKLPDKNIADAVQRVPGVTISSAAGGEGGFDENDRVSLRGTNPSLTQTLINGHSVASGDWFVLDQVRLVGRSVSFSLLPSELVSQVIVRKSATADLVEGGVAGAVDIITRKPLDFRKPLTRRSVRCRRVYADLPGKTDPQFSALINWKNDAGTMGIMLQGFYEKRHLRRDGQETLGYAHDLAHQPARAPRIPDLANVAYPTLIGSSLFEQERERKGGLIDVAGQADDGPDARLQRRSTRT